MSHYKPYPAYKDSGVDWIGQVPEHWGAEKLKYIATFAGGGTPSKENADYWNGSIPWVSPKDMKSEVISDSIDHITPEGLANSSTKLVNSGAVLLVARSGILRHMVPVGINTAPVSLNQDMKALTLDEGKIRSWFLLRWVQGLSRSLLFAWAKQGATVESLEHEYVANSLLPLPDLEEQDAILSILGRETTCIDALIQKKTRFIDLLKEKRQALITHAVTKGLNPIVKMKESGIEWIGQVPEHWEVVPSTWLFVESKERAHTDDQHLSATQKYGVIPLAEYERLEERQVTHAVKNLEQRKHVELDDFVISMRSFQGGIERVKARGCVRSSYVVLQAGNDADVNYYTYLFKSGSYIQGLQATASFIRDGQDLNYGNFRQVKLPLPCRAEQQHIADFLDRETARIDALMKTTERSITLLKERRAAFITAAVTGQIDLRGE
tara:strand:+ start:1218 stop:2531 length:1314 start_codon:yes stop_codon:yes gene_type:complete